MRIKDEGDETVEPSHAYYVQLHQMCILLGTVSISLVSPVESFQVLSEYFLFILIFLFNKSVIPSFKHHFSAASILKWFSIEGSRGHTKKINFLKIWCNSFSKREKPLSLMDCILFYFHEDIVALLSEVWG